MKHFLAAAVLALSALAYFLVVQASPSQRFGIGRWDRGWLTGEEGFYPRPGFQIEVVAETGQEHLRHRGRDGEKSE